MTARRPVAVLGSGSWGTALGMLCARNGQPVGLWVRDVGSAARIQRERVHARYFPNLPLPAGLAIHNDLANVVARYPDLVIAVPSVHFKTLLTQLAPLLSGHRLGWATKGLEPGTGRLLSEVCGELIGHDTPHAVLSGPSFAGEVARGLPTAVTVAASEAGFAEDLAAVFSGKDFRVYTSSDMVGVQLGGAVKNVLAIAAGIADGLGFGANARAGLITRGLAELMRFGEAVGAQRETLVGLSGLGDLVLTCTDDQSRNRRFGLAIGRGASLAEAKTAVGQAVEGAETARVVLQAAARAGVDMPICQAVHDILFAGLAPRHAVAELLGRSLKAESV